MDDGCAPRTVAVETDAEIVSRSIGDAQAFVTVFERHFDAIHRYLHRRVGRDLADDLSAETFLRAFAARNGFVAQDGSALPWLYGIATNLVRRHRRTEERRMRAYARTGIDPAVDLDQGAIERRADASTDGPSIAAALAMLRPRERDVVLLVALAGLTTSEAAAALDLPVGTVASRMHRARSRLQEALSPTPPATRPAQPVPGNGGRDEP